MAPLDFALDMAGRLRRTGLVSAGGLCTDFGLAAEGRRGASSLSESESSRNAGADMSDFVLLKNKSEHTASHLQYTDNWNTGRALWG